MCEALQAATRHYDFSAGVAALGAQVLIEHHLYVINIGDTQIEEFPFRRVAEVRRNCSTVMRSGVPPDQSPPAASGGAPVSNRSRTRPAPAPFQRVKDSRTMRKIEDQFWAITFNQPGTPLGGK